MAPGPGRCADTGTELLARAWGVRGGQGEQGAGAASLPSTWAPQAERDSVPRVPRAPGHSCMLQRRGLGTSGVTLPLAPVGQQWEGAVQTEGFTGGGGAGGRGCREELPHSTGDKQRQVPGCLQNGGNR